MNRQFLALAVLCLLLSACASTPKPPKQTPAVNPTAAKQPPPEKPARPFPPDTFHDLLVAEFAVHRNRFDLALGNYMQQAHETRDPGVIARATRLAEFLHADNAALDAATLWTEVEPDNLEGQFTLASELAKRGHPVQALKPMTTVLEKGGKTNFTAIAASALKLDKKERDRLEAAFDKLLERYPDNPQLLIGKALLLQQRGKAEQALTVIRKVLKADDQNLQAIIVEARLLQLLGRTDEAFARLAKVVNQHPHNRRLRLQYARMLMGKDIDAAKVQFRLLLADTPEDPDLLLTMGLISNETGHPDEAEQYFQRLLETGEDTTEAHYYLGQLEEQQKHWQKALDHYEQIPPGKDYIAAITRIAAIYVHQDKSKTALHYLQEKRIKHPEYALQLYLLESEVFSHDHQYRQGEKLLTEALLLYPKQLNLLYARSMFYEKLGQIKRMEQDLQTIIDQDPDNAPALNALGYTLINRSQRMDEAYKMIRHALDLKPNDPAIQDSLGWAEYRRGNLAQAVQLLSEAYQAFPDHEVAAHLGEVLWAIGEKKRALEVWRQGLKHTPNSPLILNALKRFHVALPPRQPESAPGKPQTQP